MEHSLYFMDIRSTDPTYNLALEEYLLTHHTEGEILLLWQNANTVVIGRNQNTEEEINRPFVEEHQITVVRRTTGGGAVYHDLENLNYSFIQDVGDPETISIAALAVPVVRALEEMGVHAELSGRNDILVDGKKISGVAQRMFRNRILHHGTLLFDSDPEMVAGALQVRQDKFQGVSAGFHGDGRRFSQAPDRGVDGQPGSTANLPDGGRRTGNPDAARGKVPELGLEFWKISGLCLS